ncbi:MAG: class II glutamine amidotransferase [Pseudomonadota bacterium]
MCRLAAYLGPPITLETLLAGPAEQLLSDAYRFGLGWYASDALPALYTCAQPAWLDANLPHLSRSLQSGLWLVHGRRLGGGPAPDALAPQPLCDEEFVFAHQGFVEGFRDTLRPALRNFLAPEIEADIKTADVAEYLFALLRHFLADDQDLSIEQALGETFALLEDTLGEFSAELNVIVSEGEGLYAVRHAINAECAPLYFTADDEAYPSGQLIAAEPFSDAAVWQPVPEHHILILDSYEPPELVPL